MSIINLLAGDSFKFGDLLFDASQFEVPKNLYGDFSRAVVKNAYKEVNGKQIQTGEIDKILLPSD